VQENSSKVVDQNGEPLVVYHQTGSEFTEFNTKNSVAGKYDNEMPTGIFLKPSNADIGLSGKKQMPLFANLLNPLRLKDRQSLSDYLIN
jgi:hypothetical protein